MDITLHTEDARWKGLRPTVRRAAEAALRAALPKPPHAVALTLLLTSDAAVQALNRDYRGKDKPTNVLSFPDGSEQDGTRYLGDIALAYETLAAEAAAQGKPLKAHLSHLTIHGVLHLLGYDHDVPRAARAMESLEVAILGSMGIANPYEMG